MYVYTFVYMYGVKSPNAYMYGVEDRTLVAVFGNSTHSTHSNHLSLWSADPIYPVIARLQHLSMWLFWSWQLTLLFREREKMRDLHNRNFDLSTVLHILVHVHVHYKHSTSTHSNFLKLWQLESYVFYHECFTFCMWLPQILCYIYNDVQSLVHVHTCTNVLYL